MDSGTRSRYPLQFIISALFMPVTLCLGIWLSIYSYNKTSEILLNSAEHVYNELIEEMKLDISRTYQPMAGIMELFAISDITRASTMEQRLKHIDTLSVAMQHNPAAANIQIAQPDGGCFVVRKPDSDEIRKTFKAPQGSRFVSDQIETEKTGRRVLNRQFYNEKLEVI